MQPISQNNPNLHKAPSTSAEFNRIQNNLHYDLTQLFNIANRHNVQIKENMDVLIRENFFLQNKINELSTALDKIKTDLLYKQNGEEKQQLIKSMYSRNGIVTGRPSEANVDTLYGIATIPDADRVSKTSFKADDQSIMIPSSLSISLMESNNVQPLDADTGTREYYNVADPYLLNAFDKNNNTFWVHTSSFPDESNVSEVYGCMVISLPLDIVNNIYANTLTLHPYPEYSMTIADIWYKGYDGTRYRLPNYPTTKDNQNNDVPVPIKDAGKLFFSFPKTEIAEIQIYFSQPYWFANEGKRDFVYGFQDIGVEYRSFNASQAELVTEFSIEGTTKRFFSIDTPTIVPAVGAEQVIDDLVEHKLYYSSDLTSEFDFGNEIMAPIQKVYVKTILKANGDVLPVIKDIKLDYVFKDINDV
jgi:hypothetical protein